MRSPLQRKVSYIGTCLFCLIAWTAFSQKTGEQPSGHIANLLSATAKGTGQTTGHIANITVTNKTNTPFVIAPQTVYIPSDGRYQSYVGRIPEGQTVAPNTTANIPVDGYCTDIHKPAVPENTAMTPIESWTPVGTAPTEGGPISIIPNSPVPAFDPSQIPQITEMPGFKPAKEPILHTGITWPGTEIPVNGTIDPKGHPREWAPLIVNVVEQIEKGAAVVQHDPTLSTPYASNPAHEKEALIQQTIWIYMGAIMGDPYQKQDFTDNVYRQYNENTGTPVSTLPKEEKENVDAGIDQFWNAFQATGAAAKVLTDTNTQEDNGSDDGNVLISATKDNCACGKIEVPLTIQVQKKNGKEWRDDGAAVSRTLKDNTEESISHNPMGDNGFQVVMQLGAIVTECFCITKQMQDAQDALDDMNKSTSATSKAIEAAKKKLAEIQDELKQVEDLEKRSCGQEFSEREK